MKFRVTAGIVSVLAVPVVAGAQQLTGLASWTYNTGNTTYDQDANHTSFLSQQYIIGYDAPVYDPRLLRFTGDLALNTSGLNNGYRRGLIPSLTP